MDTFKITIALVLMLFITQAVIPQNNCDEKKTSSSDEVKRTVENNLIESSSVTKPLSTGIEITAFYLGSSIIKISSTNNLSVSEQLFFENSALRYYDISGYDNGKEFYFIYYFENDNLFCKINALSGKPVKFSVEEEKNILKNTEEYLAAVQ